MLPETQDAPKTCAARVAACRLRCERNEAPSPSGPTRHDFVPKRGDRPDLSVAYSMWAPGAQTSWARQCFPLSPTIRPTPFRDVYPRTGGGMRPANELGHLHGELARA